LGRPCLDFDRDDIPRHGYAVMANAHYVSTRPVLEPLASESLCPCGSAR
jgi:hypothetical protein